MKTILSSRRDRYLAKFSIFLIIVALIAGMVGCAGVRYSLTISSTEGGEVKSPGEGILSPGEGTVVKLVAEPEDGYQFVNWTGNVSTIANVTAAATNITMDDDYSITANFAREIREIWDWNDLYAIRNNLHSQHILMTSLDSTSANYTELAGWTSNGGDGWQPIGTQNNKFTGSFDGQGFEIVDLYINSDDRYVGLFGYVGSGGVVQNVTVVNATVTGKDNVGGLVGNNGGTVSSSNYIGSVTGDNNYVGGLVGNNGGTVEYSHSTGNVTSEKGSYIGGLVGINDGGNVSNSYFSGSVSGDEYVGGLVGGNAKGTVSSSNSTGSVKGNKFVGGLLGHNHEGSTVSVSDSYSTGNVTGDKYIGGLVGYNYKSIVSNSHYNYHKVRINGEEIITIGALSDEDFEKWSINKSLDVNGRLDQDPKDGYYLVSNVTAFKQLLAFGQNATLKFRLTNDLYLGDDEHNFYIPYFAGNFEGNGHKISNLSLNLDSVSQLGLFGYLARGGRVSQVVVENVNITGANLIGGLVGANWEGTVINSHSTGNVSGDEYVGGLVGWNKDESTVSNSDSTGSVSGDEYVGGLVGDNKDTVSSCHFTGNVTSEGSYIGGLVGRNGDEISESYSTGSVIGAEYVGGLVGQNEGTVSSSNYTGSVSGSTRYSTRVGGLVGWNGGEISESYSKGSVTGYMYVGGLVGFNKGVTVEFSYSTGNVNGDEYIGGLVGYNEGGIVSKSYSTGSVSGYTYVGGLVGWNKDKKGMVNGSYSTGRVSDGEDVGGLVGRNDGTVSSSFWNTETSGQAIPDGGTGKTTSEMQDIATFSGAGWHIIAVDNLSTPIPSGWTWKIVNGKDYPRLWWQTI